MPKQTLLFEAEKNNFSAFQETESFFPNQAHILKSILKLLAIVVAVSTAEQIEAFEVVFFRQNSLMAAIMTGFKHGGRVIVPGLLDYVHTGPDEFETVLKFVRLQLFTRNRTNYRPKSVHTEPDEFVAEIILY